MDSGQGRQVSGVATLDAYLPYLLHRADAAISRAFHRSLSKQAIEVSEWRVLASLLRLRRSTMGELAHHADLPQPTTSHTVARLVARGHVAREDGKKDRRFRFVTLTAEGRTEAERLMTEALACERAAIDRLTADRSEDLRELLRVVIVALESDQDGATV